MTIAVDLGRKTTKTNKSLQCMFTEKKEGNRAPLAEMDKDETDVLHHQGAIGGINLSFSPRKSSETDKEEGMVKF